MSLTVMIAAGGTGGHMVPAHALSEALLARGHRTVLLTDKRGLRFPGLFEGVPSHVIASATASGGNPVGWLRAMLAISRGRAAARRIAREAEADAVVGFGGYPSLPGILAGIAERLAVILHEQNAVLGRVNRRLQSRVSAIALTYEDTARLDGSLRRRAHVTGNPVRAAVLEAAGMPWQPPLPDAPFRLLVVGGSQGARILGQMVPAAVASLSKEERRRLLVVQQCRAEDLTAVAADYQQAGVDADCTPYMPDLPQRMAAADLVISRAGASSVAELMAIGRAAILVPFAAATDDHQTANAQGFARAGGGFVIPERELSVDRLAGHLRGFMAAPEALAAAAAAARGLGRPDAAERLADLVEREVAERGGAR